jgi:hypothetical protein
MISEFENLGFIPNEKISIRHELESNCLSNSLLDIFQTRGTEISKKVSDLQRIKELGDEIIPKGIGNNSTVQTIVCLDFNVERNFDDSLHNLLIKYLMIYIKENFSDLTKIPQRILGEPWYPRLFHLGTGIDSKQISHDYR